MNAVFTSYKEIYHLNVKVKLYNSKLSHMDVICLSREAELVGRERAEVRGAWVFY